MDMKKLIESMDRFAGDPEQKPADQVRGTDKAKFGGKKHPFLNRLVGDAKKLKVRDKQSLMGEGNLEEQLAMEYSKFLEGYQVVPPIDTDRYSERPGLEGPFRMKSGKVVYYDPKEGEYYDADSDMYMGKDQTLDEYGSVSTNSDLPTTPTNSQMTKSAGSTTTQQQATQQTAQQTAQQAIQQNGTVAPQDVAIGFLKGMGVQNPQKAQVDALAKTLGKNLKTGQ
jgi:hypothetical protein